MPYQPHPIVATGDLYTAAMYNTFIRENFLSSVPGSVTGTNQIIVGSGEKQHTFVSIPSVIGRILTKRTNSQYLSFAESLPCAMISPGFASGIDVSANVWTKYTNYPNVFLFDMQLSSGDFTAHRSGHHFLFFFGKFGYASVSNIFCQMRISVGSRHFITSTNTKASDGANLPFAILTYIDNPSAEKISVFARHNWTNNLLSFWIDCGLIMLEGF